MEKYEFLEHTADIKIRVNGAVENILYENAVLAISEYLSDEKKIESRKTKTISVSGTDKKSLLYNFIEEILFLIDSNNFVPAKASVILRGNNLKADISGDDSNNYHLQQIKAPTYAEMEIKKNKLGWYAQFVLDV
jgi:SHS2 domain-containing protein